TPSSEGIYGVRPVQDYPAQQQYTPQPTVNQPQMATGANIRNMPYSIQMAATTKPASMSSSDFVRIKQLFNLDVYEVFSNGVYRYFAGGFNTSGEANAMCDKINSALGKTGDAKAFVKPMTQK
ncbi:MAG: SPOR domain-containing protein, partial [Prevotellaceae bacterium]|nr:SPOR domain-containing protein [Prevotellaceae bacterium]